MIGSHASVVAPQHALDPQHDVSVAPSVTPALYRLLGANAARHAKGGTPDPARNPYSDEAIEARYHTTVIALMELERRRMVPGAVPEELSLEGLT